MRSMERYRYLIPEATAALGICGAEDDNRDLPVRALPVALVSAVHRHEFRPEPLSLARSCLRRPYAHPAVLDLDRGPGVCPEVQPPGRVGRRIAVRSHDHEALAVPEIEER